ncbi:glycosyltransferase [Pontibacter toksunensis]|uniref:Glycosyltransferase n=1 Tax=Pontibacter toksunensis TaxID=1332631 RepID=A0ABW6BSE3_9BACT
MDLIKKKARDHARQSFSYIAHPHYRKYYRNNVSRQDARNALGVPSDDFVFLFLGQIRGYKNVTGLIKAYKNLKGGKTTLLIAGSVHQDTKAELRQYLKNTDSILFTDSFVKDEELQLYFNCADVVVTPYNKIFNSGSVFLNLSFGKPTLAPDVSALAEIKQLVGPRWLKTYKGQISAEVLEKYMAEVISESSDIAAASPNIDCFDPDTIARETIAFYNVVLEHKNLPADSKLLYNHA